MPQGALTPALVDMPVGDLNQQPPTHDGPTGRLTALVNGIVTHYNPGDGAKKTLTDPRGGFQSMSQELRSPTTGQVASGSWANPQLLAPLDRQLVSVNNSIPRVWNGDSWTYYSDNRVNTRQLTERVVTTTNSSIVANSHSRLGTVTCHVWTEQVPSGAGFIGSSWVGFQADDGGWVRVPTQLWAPNDATQYALAKVCNDGTYFWVFFNDLTTITVAVYDSHGDVQGASGVGRNCVATPGYWDINGDALTGVLLAQPGANPTGAADVHVELTLLTFSGSIHTAVNTDTSINCVGPVAWCLNPVGNGKEYLGTIGYSAINAGGVVCGYEINPATPASTHAYLSAQLPLTLPDSLTGFADNSSGTVSLGLCWSELSPGGYDGSPFDPATRFTKTTIVTHAGAVTTNARTTNSVILQSRAFLVDNEPYAFTYYQSGSGQNLPSAPVSVSVTSGDYIIGPRVQPLTPRNGDYTTGSPFTYAGTAVDAIQVTNAVGSWSVAAGDTVALSTASGIAGVEDGTPILVWTFAAYTSPGGNMDGSRLTISGTSIGSANTTWEICQSTGTGHVIKTLSLSIGGSQVTPGTFTTAGTGLVRSMTIYRMSGLAAYVPPEGADRFLAGSMVVTGNANPNNNGTKTIQRLVVTAATAGNEWGPGVWIYTASEATSLTSYTAAVSPASPNLWNFDLGFPYDPSYVGGVLQVSNDAHPENNGDFVVTAATGSSLTTNDAAYDIKAEDFSSPFPTVSFEISATTAPFTLYLQAVTFDYSYIGALVSIGPGAGHEANNGVYKIISLVDDHHVIVAPTNGLNNQRSEQFSSEPPPIFIQLAANVDPALQPTWFLTPLTGKQPQVGCFEKGLAYGEWRYDAETGQARDRYAYALANVSPDSTFDSLVALPYRAVSFTQATIATAGNSALNIANLSTGSTVGLKMFRLALQPGNATEANNELLIPGPMAVEFTGTVFHESNVNVAPEAPFLLFQGTDTDTTFALTPLATYVYQAVARVTDNNGQTILSIPSPQLVVPMAGTNNYNVIGGRLINPLASTGLPSVNAYGVSNHAMVVYDIYRTVRVDGAPSTELHLITQVNNPNGLYSGSGTGSGFQFLDEFTWHYRDENPDAAIQATEVVYAGANGRGIAPHWPCPPHSSSSVFSNRRWVVGYDGAVWFSAEFVEGEAEWFFPGWRYPFPPDDPAVAVVGFENYAFVFCERTAWRIPLAQFPNATLTLGGLPSPVQITAETGCNGQAVACLDFVAYASRDGSQVWAITRNLQNVYLSEQILDDLGTDNHVTQMCTDGKQRLLVQTSDDRIRVFDPISKGWWFWDVPSPVARLSQYQGQPVYADQTYVMLYSPDNANDKRGTDTTGISLDVTWSNVSFAQARAVKRLWEVQAIGLAANCNINAVISYPDDAQPDTTFGPSPVTATPGSTLLLAMNPTVEEAGSYGFRVWGTFEGQESPGRCFSLEMLSCEVGLDRRMGGDRLPNGFRIMAG